jgi:hypothetical protein
MLVSRATRAPIPPKSPNLATKEREPSLKRAPVPLLPVILLICCGVAASRLLPGVAPRGLVAPSTPADILPRPSPVELSLAEQSSGLAAGGSLQPDVQALLQTDLRCQNWCLERAEASASPMSRPPLVATCYAQCLAHPEVTGFFPALEASAALPIPTGRTLLFAAWYAEGERGAEVGPDTLLMSAVMFYIRI